MLSSAAVYAASFFNASFFWWGIFLFLIPLFFIQFRTLRTTFFYACLWGLIAYTPHYACVAQVIADKALCWWSYGLLVALIGCFLLPTIIWFFLLHHAYSHNYYRFSFVTLSFFYKWYLYHGLFFFMGLLYGHPLTFPLLPLFVAYPDYGMSVWTGGKWFALMVMFTLPIMILTSVRMFCMAAVIAAGWYAGAYMFAQPQKITDLFIPVCPRFDQQGLQQLSYVQEALRAQPFTDRGCLVLPESAISFDYRKIPYLATLLTDEVGIDDRPILFGTHLHNHKDGLSHNVLACVHDGRITVIYVKQKLMPFFEEPHWLEDVLQRYLFIKKAEKIDPGQGAVLTEIPTFGFMQPLICSESLWHVIWGKPFPLLVIVHDAHFSFLYVKKLMRAAVRLQAQTMNRGLIYSSYAP